MTEKPKGIIAQIRNQAKEDYKRDLINKLIKNLTSDDDPETLIIPKKHF